jgi:hypothetical protein
MKCKKILKKIIEISFLKISPQKEVEKHIAQCPVCKKAQKDINSIINITQIARKIEIPQEEMFLVYNNIMQEVEQVTNSSIKDYIKSLWKWKSVKASFASALIIIISISVMWLNPFSKEKIDKGSQITGENIPSSLTIWPDSENDTGIYYIDIGVI